MRLPGESGAGALGVAFPPRDESFRFRQELETVYRTGLQRAETSSYVDAEGDLVWTQEYLRYRVNGCGHAEAAARTLAQIDGAGIAPVCGDTPPGVVSFPPRDESYRFRLQLEAQYRDQLRRPPSPTSLRLYPSSPRSTSRALSKPEGRCANPPIKRGFRSPMFAMSSNRSPRCCKARWTGAR